MATAIAQRSIRLLGKTSAELARTGAQSGEVFYDTTNQTLRLSSSQSSVTLATREWVTANAPSVNLTGYATQTYVNTQINSLINSNAQTLAALEDITSALSDQTAQGAILAEIATKADTSALSTVAFSGSYADLTNKPTIFNGNYNSLTNRPSIFSGRYSDLTDKPTIPNDTSQLSNGAGYAVLPSQTGNTGKYLTTNGTNTSWVAIVGGDGAETDPVFLAHAAYNVTTTKISNWDTAYGWGNHASAGYLTGTISYTSLSNKPTLFSGSYADLTNKPTLFSGSYTDLTNKPTIPSLTGYATESYVTTAVSNLVDAAPSTLDTLNELAAALGDDANYAATITTALGAKADTSSLATVATSGSYADLTNKPTIPTQYTDALARSALSTAAGSGAYNSSTGVITIPTNTSHLTNGAGFITSTGIPSQSGNSGRVLSTDGTTLSWTVAATGSVASVSVASANGFTGTVATSTTTPSITIATSITGVLKGNGTAISAAVAGTDYQAPITLTTTGSSGAATFSNGTLNIPQYSGGGAEADTLSTVTGRGATTATAVSITNATASTTTTSGALIVTGGVGVGGSIYTGGTLYGTANTFNIAAAPGGGIGGNGKNITISSGAAPDTGQDAGVITLQGGAGFTGSSTAGNINIIGGDAPFAGLGGSITLTAGLGGTGGTPGKVLIDRTTASSSTTTGALVVSGGVGIGENLNIGGTLSAGGLVLSKVLDQYDSLVSYIDPAADSAVSFGAAASVIYIGDTIADGNDPGNARYQDIYIGHSSMGPVYIGNSLSVSGTSIYLGSGSADTVEIYTNNTGQANLFNSSITSVNAFSKASTISIGKDTGILAPGTTTFTNISGTAPPQAVTQSGILSPATSGSGTGTMLYIQKTGTGTSWSGVTTIQIANPDLGGKDYAVGDTITITGNVLGGTSPANDLTCTVASVSSSTTTIKSNLVVNGGLTVNGPVNGITTSSNIIASAAAADPDIGAYAQYCFTDLAVDLTINAPIGTPVDGNKLMFRILDNGTARAITWNATYTVIGTTLPTTTIANKMIYIGCIYNATNTRWDVIAVTTQA